MGIILCQFCDHVIAYVNHEKVSTMYAACHECNEPEQSTVEED